MDISEFTEAESNMCDLISEYQQYGEASIEDVDSVQSSAEDVRVSSKKIAAKQAPRPAPKAQLKSVRKQAPSKQATAKNGSKDQVKDAVSKESPDRRNFENYVSAVNKEETENSGASKPGTSEHSGVVTPKAEAQGERRQSAM